jgi:hypothetical protein
MYVNMRGGRQGGLGARNGCNTLESVFVYLLTEMYHWLRLVRPCDLRAMQGEESASVGMTVSR